MSCRTGMDFKRLHYFVAVGEELNLRRAAQRLGVSQPAVSIQINTLETELGLDLVIRDQQRIVGLTAAGKHYLADAQRLLAALDGATQAAQAVARGKQGVLRLALCEEVSSVRCLNLLRDCRTAMPDVAFQFAEMVPAELPQALSNGDVNAALVFKPLEIAQVQYLPLWQEGWLAAVPLEHELAQRSELHCHDLQGVGLILSKQAVEGIDADPVRAALIARGVMPKVVMSALRRSTMLTFAMSGLGVAFVPASLRDIHLPNLRLIPVQDAVMQVSLAYLPAHASIELQRLLQIITAVPAA
ncbi:MAG: LysR family transcriptional regulator [Steroidobacteraceae bacterium]